MKVFSVGFNAPVSAQFLASQQKKESNDNNYQKNDRFGFLPSYRHCALYFGALDKHSALQQARFDYQPKLPKVFENGIRNISLTEDNSSLSKVRESGIKKVLPNVSGLPAVVFEQSDTPASAKIRNVGVILSGGQAPGGHNVIAGLFDALKEASPDSKLYGFLGGPSGIIDGKSIEITKDVVDKYRNTGGFDMIGSGRTKLEQKSQFDKTLDVCKNLDLSSVVIIGGDDSNTNAALMADYFKQKGSDVQVIGCPKTIDGDLKSEHIEAPFGFDTATKTYSELIGNIERDALSAKKYWHFVKIMGRSASHVALECALQTHPNIAIMSEEVAQKHMSMDEIVDSMVDVIVKRADKGMNYGVVIIPEGLIEFVPEMKSMISNINNIIAKTVGFDDMETDEKIMHIADKLDDHDSKIFSELPRALRKQLVLDRDPHGNVQVSKIDTERLLIQMIEIRLKEKKANYEYSDKFAPLSHFLGYEGRCAAPSNFDANYCYSLGYNTVGLIQSGLTGYISTVKNLTAPAEEWIPGGIPITNLMHFENRNGKMKPVIEKALVKTDGPVFKEFEKQRDKWALEDDYVFPGSIQYWGPSKLCDLTTLTLGLEKN